MACVQLSPNRPLTAEAMLKIKEIYHKMMIAGCSAPGGVELENICSIPVAIPANSVATIV